MTNHHDHDDAVPFQPRRLMTAGDAMRFLNGGAATITLVSVGTGTRYTYRINVAKDRDTRKRPESPDRFFVNVMYGPDNENDYLYVGQIYAGKFGLTKNSKVTDEDKRFRAFAWFYDKISGGRLPDSMEVWHEGRCCRCNRKLTVPESIESGIGPECAKREGGAPRRGRLTEMAAAF